MTPRGVCEGVFLNENLWVIPRQRIFPFLKPLFFQEDPPMNLLFPPPHDIAFIQMNWHPWRKCISHHVGSSWQHWRCLAGKIKGAAKFSFKMYPSIRLMSTHTETAVSNCKNESLAECNEKHTKLFGLLFSCFLLSRKIWADFLGARSRWSKIPSPFSPTNFWFVLFVPKEPRKKFFFWWWSSVWGSREKSTFWGRKHLDPLFIFSR